MTTDVVRLRALVNHATAEVLGFEKIERMRAASPHLQMAPVDGALARAREELAGLQRRLRKAEAETAEEIERAEAEEAAEAKAAARKRALAIEAADAAVLEARRHADIASWARILAATKGGGPYIVAVEKSDEAERLRAAAVKRRAAL